MNRIRKPLAAMAALGALVAFGNPAGAQYYPPPSYCTTPPYYCPPPPYQCAQQPWLQPGWSSGQPYGYQRQYQSVGGVPGTTSSWRTPGGAVVRQWQPRR